MNMQKALEECSKQRRKVRCKRWSRSVYVTIGIAGSYIFKNDNTSFSKSYTPNSSDLIDEWEFVNDYQEEIEEISRIAKKLESKVMSICGTHVCSECPLREALIDKENLHCKNKDLNMLLKIGGRCI